MVVPIQSPRFNPRPAFFCGATIYHHIPALLTFVSIRAPRSSAGRRFAAIHLRVSTLSFNPRPAFFCGATWRSGRPEIYQTVSIRAPRSSAGRPTGIQVLIGATAFQSAPRVLLRGDAPLAGLLIWPTTFQSAPRVLLRGDAMGSRSTVHPAGFQSAPRVLLRGDRSERPG